MKKIEKAVIAGLILTIFLNVISFGAKSRNIYEDVLRLHIIANSDSAEDQALKLKVRDAILSQGYFIFDGVADISGAKKTILNNEDKIKEATEKVIRENGYDYEASVALENTFFETRYYDNFTLPAGEYEAVKITIGEGKGHNWWCVMFPPLCLGSASEIAENGALSEGEKDVILSNPNYEIRFKIVEIYESIKEKVTIQ